jgi:prophage regulatory protein
MSSATRLIRLPEVISRTGLSRSSIYRLEKQGRFVPRVRLSDRATAWNLDQVTAWIEARPLAEATPLSVARGENSERDPLRS